MKESWITVLSDTLKRDVYHEMHYMTLSRKANLWTEYINQWFPVAGEVFLIAICLMSDITLLYNKDEVLVWWKHSVSCLLSKPQLPCPNQPAEHAWQVLPHWANLRPAATPRNCWFGDTWPEMPVREGKHSRVGRLSQWDLESRYIGETDFHNKQVGFCYSPDFQSLRSWLCTSSHAYPRGVCAGLSPTSDSPMWSSHAGRDFDLTWSRVSPLAASWIPLYSPVVHCGGWGDPIWRLLGKLVP